MSVQVGTRCAVVETATGLVVNIIIALPSDPAPNGCHLVEVMNGQPCDMGWLFEDGGFTDPNGGSDGD
jgi:hypothetical protein